jgi:hypothetical protein
MTLKCFYKLSGITRNKFLSELLEEVSFRYSEFTVRQIVDIFLVYGWVNHNQFKAIEDVQHPLHVFMPLLSELQEAEIYEKMTLIQISQLINFISELDFFNEK